MFLQRAAVKSVLGGRVWGAASAVPSVLSRSMALWSVEREPGHKFKSADEIINEKEIERLLESTKKAAQDKSRVREILQTAKDHALLKHLANTKSEYVQGLTLEEAATLLNVDVKNKDLMQELYDTALDIKRQIYGNRIVLFAPLYLSNYCTNACTYCAFRAPNEDVERSCVSDEDLVEEVKALQRQGHRRLLLLTGESPKYTFDHFLKAIDIASSVRTEPCGKIRRINVEIPTLSVSDFRRLKETNQIGTYTLFQETYHRKTFRRVHPAGPKANYSYRVQTFDRAQTAGIDDVGLGALFGLYDYRFEVLALLMHAHHLDTTYGAGPHTISIPRMQPALNAPDALRPPAPVNDDEFKKLVAVIRCSVPYTGMILSTRESPEIRRALLELGISQMSAGSKTGVNAYHRESPTSWKRITNLTKTEDGQFELSDLRSLDEIVHDLMETGYVPSWCTACYRAGRTGEAFMRVAKKGEIQNFCHPNALLTLQEFLDDYASETTKKKGLKVVERESDLLTNQRAKKAFEKKLEKIKEGERDLYF